MNLFVRKYRSIGGDNFLGRSLILLRVEFQEENECPAMLWVIRMTILQLCPPSIYFNRKSERTAVPGPSSASFGMA